MVLDRTSVGNMAGHQKIGLTPIMASHKVRKGVWTVALIWPQAAMIRFTAARTSGWCVNISDRDVGLQGASRDGKSRLCWGRKSVEFSVLMHGDGGGDAYTLEREFTERVGRCLGLAGPQ